MTHLLTAFGCRVSAASTVADALKKAEHQRFNLVISDFGLPDASGTDLSRQPKSKYPVRSIALSGWK